MFATGSGLYWLDIVDHYINQYGLVVAGILECLIIGWILRAKVLRNHINAVSSRSIGRGWDFLIKFVTPVILVIILGAQLFSELNKPYGGYSVQALLLLGVLWVFATIILALLFTIPRWEKAKLKYDHFADEDKVLV